jgi:hypothetical protein
MWYPGIHVAAWSDADIQEQLDRQTLDELLVRYCRAIDRLDLDLARSCFHPDATDDHGAFKGLAHDFLDQLFARAGGSNVGFVAHLVSNVSLTIDGDSADGESYVGMRQLRDGQLIEGFGRFVDHFERRNGQWRVASRRVILDWATPGRGYQDAGFAKGSRDRSDPSYVGGSTASALSTRDTHA